MTQPNSPVIVRQSPAKPSIKPGMHAYNARRRFHAVREHVSRLSILQLCLAALGLLGIGYYTYTLVDQYVYQSFQNWAFEEGIAGRSNVNFGDYLREQTLFGFMTRQRSPVMAKKAVVSPAPAPAASIKPVHGAVLGRLEIARLHLSAMVREGVDDKTLGVAVGHVPATALAGQPGNFAIAAHRDTLFRALKDIRSNDLVTFQLPDGTAYQYRVAATQIVRPSDVNVLRADGGGLITGGGSTQGMPRLLTMITCYPFAYVGSAPKRFIVEARMIEGDETAKPAVPEPVVNQPAAPAPEPEAETLKPVSKTGAHAATHGRKSSSRTRHVSAKHTGRVSLVSPPSATPAKPAKKKNFWRKIFGNG